MAIELRELVHQVQHMKMKLVAGEEGLDRNVSWVHMVENMEISDFLRGNEVTFTTGVGLNDRVTLLELVKHIYRNGGSGVVLNVGPYIEKIPEEVIAFGNEKSFPVFEVPWEVHMAEIIRIFCFAILKSEQNTAELTQAFRNALFLPQQEDGYVPVLMQKGYFIEWNYTVVEMDVCDVAMIGESEKIYMPITEDRINMVHKKVEGLLHNFSKEAVLLEEKNKFILIFVNHSEEKVVKFMKEVRQRLLPFLRKNETFFIGIGRATKSIRCVSKSFGMATKIIKMLQLENKEMEIYSNKEMGVYRLLLAIGDRETMLDYIADTIEPLREYDALNNENLTEVLQKYMEHNGNIKEIAEEMFVHRNTINYKLKKIENILHAELRDWHICQQLEIGFRLEKIIKMYHV